MKKSDIITIISIIVTVVSIVQGMVKDEPTIDIGINNSDVQIVQVQKD